MKRFLPALLSAALVASACSLAAQPLASASASKVNVEVRLSTDRVRAGSSVQAAAVLTIADGWHINSSTPSEDYLIGTALELTPREGFILADLQYPKGKLIRFDFADAELDVYEGTVPIFLTLRLSEKLAPGTYVLAASVRVQACDNSVCLPPSSIPLSLPVTVVGSDEEVRSINEKLFDSYDPARGGTLAGENPIGNLIDSEGMLVALLGIFFIGLALNLTPCVYPMMTVTVSLFGGQSDTKILRVFFKAVVYVLGIAAMYSVLGMTAALGGGLFGSWLQSPWVLAGIAVLLFGLALSMFGLYQIQAPYWLTSKLGGTTGTGLIGLFASGLVVGIFAAPCIGPPVIALLAFVGAKGDPVFGFWVFFVLSMGLGFPYLILGTFSGLLKRIPRSGVWLVWVERIFGVVLTAAALFYLSLAFFPKYSAMLVPLTLVVGGVYLGFLEPSGKEQKGFQRVKWVFGVLAIAAGLWGLNALRQPSVSWEPYSAERIEQARASGKPVMIDFYADWCIPCLELDRKTFTDAQVIDATKNFVRLKVDLTHFDSPESERIRQHYTIAGVPTIVFLDRTGHELESARVVGYIPPKEFLQRLQPLLAER